MRSTTVSSIPDQPVLAIDEVRYQGESVAIVAADHPETARRAVDRIVVKYEVLTPVVDAEQALGPGADVVHPERQPVAPCAGAVRRSRMFRPTSWCPESTKSACRTRRSSARSRDWPCPPRTVESTSTSPPSGCTSTRSRSPRASGLPPEKVRLSLAGVGGAFGAREDLSMQVHASMMALRTGRPVKIVYGREESFFGHVHRHPAKMRYEMGARRDGRLVYVRARIVLDGGAYASSSTAVCANAATLGIGPYRVPNVVMDSYVAYTNNPPCGAMRGFGAVQACFGYESTMDRLAAALGIDPVELRIRNALETGDTMPTGQIVDGPAPVAQLLRLVASAPVPKPATDDLRQMPGGVSNTTHGEGVVRGVGYGVSIKNVGFSEGFDDYATARVRLHLVGGSPAVVVHTAAAEVGQGLVTVQAQIARTELGVDQVTVAVADTSVGSAGSTSASRQTYMTGGAVRAACIAVRERVLSRVGGAQLVAGTVVNDLGEPLVDLADVLRDGAIEETVQWRHRPTEALDPVTGQGNAHVQYAFAAHRATVDVDTELGLVRVVEIATAQDVGKAVNPQAVLGQIHGGTAQGLGLALMEEIQMADGVLRNPSFTDYLIPTILDMPPMHVDVLELGDPHAPYGLRGVGEPPTISSTPAIVAAIRAATGRPLNRVPVRPEHIVAD